ncbi:hypothetical protein BC830DRAFT_1134654 [Chytriomyces sp. MP71]|nr:hypothetical protein BC830DRAFT_1134654 [Chytriomyces sp. MP71]
MEQTVGDKLRNRRSNLARIMSHMNAGTSSSVSLIGAIEAAEARRIQQAAAGQGHLRYAGPAPPETWTRTAHRVTVMPQPSSTRSHSEGPPSLLTLAARAVAVNLPTSMPASSLSSASSSGRIRAVTTFKASQLRLVASLSFHLKQLLLEERARSTQQGATLRMQSSVLLACFLDTQMRDLCVAFSDATVEAIAQWLPHTLKKQPSEIVPDVWDEEESNESEAEAAKTGNASLLGCTRLQSLDLSFTRLANPLKLIKALSPWSMPLLRRLNLSGCFDAVSGPPFLSMVSRILINLDELNVSYNAWMDQKVANALPIEADCELGLLRILVAVGCGCDPIWLLEHMRARRKHLRVITCE